MYDHELAVQSEQRMGTDLCCFRVATLELFVVRREQRALLAQLFDASQVLRNLGFE